MNSRFTHPRIVSTALALLLCACAFLQLSWGVASVPAPLALTLRALFGYDEAVAARLVVGIEFAAAAAVLCVGRRFFALFVAAAMTFIALACVSRAMREGGMMWSVITLVLSAGLLERAARSTPVVGSPRRGLSPAWSAALAIVALTGVGRIASSASFASSDALADAGHTHEGHTHDATPSKTASTTPITIDLDMHEFLGRALSDTPLLGYLPMLGELIGGDPAFIVFYNPDCETCHTLIREHFALPRMEIVIAVEIPAAESMKPSVSTGDEPLSIECANCTLLMLPPGPNWLIAPPTVLKIEHGVITCVADRYKGDCFGSQ